MKSSRLAYIGLVSVLTVLHLPAHAASIVFQQSVNTDLYGVISDSDYSDFGDISQILDDFVPVMSANVLSLEWYGSPAITGAQPILDSTYLIRFYEDDNGQPATNPIYSQTVAASPVETVSSALRDQYRYAANISGMAVTPGSTYYLSIVETNPATNSSFGDPVWGWANGDNSASNGAYALDASTGSWIQTSFLSDKDFAFTLYDTNITVIPIPPALWLFGTGLMGLFGIARRKQAT